MKTTSCCPKTATVSRCFALLLLTLGFAFRLQAQEKENFDVNARMDMVSQNIWRGTYQAGASLQPSLGVNYKNLELSVWGTSDFKTDQQEIDISFNYSFFNFTLGITDYWNGNATAVYSQNHQCEANILYTFPKISLSLVWNTLFYGEEISGNFSSYAEINYLLKLPVLDFNFSIGCTPWKNQMLGTEKFAVTQLSVATQKQFAFNKQLGLDLSFTLLYNPNADQLFWVAGIGFSLLKP